MDILSSLLHFYFNNWLYYSYQFAICAFVLKDEGNFEKIKN